jgi:hypothetical protein
MNARLQIMADSREIEEADAPDREVVARWRKALATDRDAATDLGQDSKLTLYYQAGLQAATALIRASGFRVLGTDHHRHTFEALRALDLGELSVVARELNTFRRSRHQAVYDWDDDAHGDSDETASLEALTRGVGRLMRLGYAWPFANRPSVAAAFEQPRAWLQYMPGRTLRAGADLMCGRADAWNAACRRAAESAKADFVMFQRRIHSLPGRMRPMARSSDKSSTNSRNEASPSYHPSQFLVQIRNDGTASRGGRGGTDEARRKFGAPSAPLCFPPRPPRKTRFLSTQETQ